MKVTIKQQVRNGIDRLIKTEKFITWDNLQISPYVRGKYLTYEGRIVFKYMKEINVEYIRYSEHFADNNFHGNCKVFYNNIAERRRRKIQQINKSIRNN